MYVLMHIFGKGYSGKIAMKFAKLLHENMYNGRIELKSVTSLSGYISHARSIVQYAPFLLQAHLPDTYIEIRMVALATKINDALTSEQSESLHDLQSTRRYFQYILP